MQIFICVRVWYIWVFMCIHVCVCIWVLVWTYQYALICVCVGECVFAIFIWHFNPSSVFLYIIYIAHCAIIFLCTLMLCICDRSTPDLNKDDELKYNHNNLSTYIEMPWYLHVNDRATYVCVSKLSNHWFRSWLAPDRCQAIIWTDAGILLIET